MATGNVGNLNVKLTLTAAQFGAALSAAGGDVNKFAMQVQGAQTQTRALGNAVTQSATSTSSFASAAQRLGMTISPLSYMVADFSSQLGPRGLGGALQAASNNLQVLGVGFGPWGLAVTSTIGMVTQVVGSYMEATERAAKATKNLQSTAFSGRLDTLTANAMGPMQLSGQIGAVRSQSDLNALTQPRFQRLNEIRRMQTLLQQEERDNSAKLGDAQRRGAREAAMAGTPEGISTRTRDEIKSGLDNQAELQRRQRALVDEQKKIDAEMKQINESGVIPKTLRDARNAEIEQNKADREARRRSILGQYETPMDKYRREQEELQKALKAGDITQQEFDRANSILSRSQMSAVQPTVGAFDSRTAQGYSQLQESLRSAMSMTQKPQEKAGQETAANTKQTATNTANIERRLRDIRIANIA